MKTVKRILLMMSTLMAVLLLGGCLPAVPPSPGVGGPLLSGMALSCLTPLAILFVIALVVLLILYLVRSGSGGSPLVTPPAKEIIRNESHTVRAVEPDAKEIARRRYAAGEINYDELQEILRHLDETGKGGAT